MNRALVIYGDRTIGNAISGGIVSAELERVQAENRHLNAVVGVRREMDAKRWKRTKRRLARKYRIKPVGRLEGAILAVWGGLLWLEIYEWYQYMSKLNRR